MSRSCTFARYLITACLLAGLTPVGAQLAPSHSSPFAGLIEAPAGFVATPAPQPLAEVQGEVDPALLGDLAAFEAAAGGQWWYQVDRRSGGLALAEGSGASFGAAGAGLAGLEAAARAFVDDYPAVFRVPSSQLVLDPKGSRVFGENGRFAQILFRQEVDGVAVDASAIVFRLAHGRLVQFGVGRIAPEGSVGSTSPSLSPAEARAALADHVGGLLADDLFLDDGSLHVALRGTDDEVGYSGPIGAGWSPALVYRFRFSRSGVIGEWEALVDAHSGEVVRFVDALDYLSVLKASVYTRTNCTDPSNCQPGTESELGVTMPFAEVSFQGGTCSGDGCYTNAAGAFEYPAGAVSATTSLQGKYFQLVDGCGPVTGAGVAPGDIDLGGSDPAPVGNTDCAPASRETPPNDGPAFGGPGDTHSARTMYYHLNLINQKSRYYLPHNDWLQGVDGSDLRPTIYTNVGPVCNAFWSGGIDALIFMKYSGQCNNTGEVPAVGLHEFGHGLDEHDGSGRAPESATGEAMGDTFALLQDQGSCIGSGLRLPLPTNPYWGAAAGYGSATTGSESRLCSGVRDLDFTRYCNRGASDNPDCVAARDPDAPNGSRSGMSPPPEPAGDFGTPARWNHMIETAPVGVADGQSNFYNCGGPETLTGCAGPLNHGCHCESLIASQTNWDLAKMLIADEFGGDIYNDPQGPTELSGWQYMDRLWYLTRDLAVSGYSVTGQAPEGTTNGCTVTDWYSTYRFIDDDNGDLSDGTPHGDLLFAAFDLHGIACGQASEPANLGSGCGDPIAAPALATCSDEAPVQLEWTVAESASRYRVLRNTLGCGFGFLPLDEVAGTRDYFEDAEIAPGVTYYYSVQPVGANASCYGQASNCVTVKPAACQATSLAPPAGVAAASAGDGAVQVSWDAVAGAAAYKILRREGTCDAPGPAVAVGRVPAPETSFVDSDRLEGGSVYSYEVVSAETACASCTSAPSACVSVEVTGECALPPSFAGVESVTTLTGGSCGLTVGWSPGTASCGSDLTYDVHRSTDPSFMPSDATRVATGVAATSYVDTDVESGTRYHYIVRAVDEVGNGEGNLERRYEIPSGPPAGGPYADDAGDTGAAKLFPAFTPGNRWSVRESDPTNPSRVYATSPSGNYPDDSCMALETETIFLGADPALSFRSRFAIEPAWDGGIIVVATEGGGFSDWTKLDSILYPGVMGGVLGDPACGHPGLADGQAAFSGISPADQWLEFSGSLADFANQAVRIRFLFASDAASNDLGWFVDDVTVSDSRLASACTGGGGGSEVCGEIDDGDAVVDYRAGWHQKAHPEARGGGYHQRMGGGKGKASTARMTFEADAITYHYAVSDKGGSAAVLIDGVEVDVVSYDGAALAFGHSRTYSDLGPGSHEIVIEHRGGAVFVDGFTLHCATGDAGADAAAVEYRSATETSTHSLGPSTLTRSVTVGEDDVHLSIVVEGTALPVTVTLVDPLGTVLATGGALLEGLAVSGVDAAVSAPGTYTVQVIGGTLPERPVEMSIAHTVRVP